MRPIKGEQYRPNQEPYTPIAKITHTNRKRRIQFYEHLHSMSLIRITKRVLTDFKKLKMASTWIKETEKDIDKINISPDRTECKRFTGNIKVIQKYH